MPNRTIIVTGASSGFGAMTARHLADAGHTVYAGMRTVEGDRAAAAREARDHAAGHDVALRVVQLDVVDQDSVDAAVATVMEEAASIDVVVDNAGHTWCSA